MAYKGQPIPSTVLPIAQIKISDGKSVDVTVPASNGVQAGEFCVVDGFFGVALQTVDKDKNTNGTLIALQTEQAEYITTQIDTSKTFAIGSALYFDSATKKLTDDSSVSGAILVGRITSAKDKNNVIQFVLYPQNVSTTSGTKVPEQLDHIANATGQTDAHTVLNSLLAGLIAKGFMKGE